MRAAIEQLIDAAWQAVEERRDKCGGRQVSRPAFEALEEARLESRFDDGLAVIEHLDSALSLAQAQELGHIAAGLREVIGEIRWSQNPSYDESNCSRELLDGYAYGGLSGPDSPVACEMPLAGFLVMAPNITYPDHWHPPSEIYLVLTPGSQWRLDGGDWFDVAAGDLMLHGPNQKHATRSADQPFLAFVAWLERGHRSNINI